MKNGLPLFAFLAILMNTQTPAADYFPLAVGNLWVSSASLPLPPGSECMHGEDWIERIDSVIEHENFSIFYTGCYVINSNDTCLVLESSSIYLDSAGKAITLCEKEMLTFSG